MTAHDQTLCIKVHRSEKGALLCQTLTRQQGFCMIKVSSQHAKLHASLFQPLTFGVWSIANTRFFDGVFKRSFDGLARSPAHLEEAYDCIQCLKHFIPQNESTGIFFLVLIHALDLLASGQDPKTIRMIFQAKLLRFLGHMPDLAHCSVCNTHPSGSVLLHTSGWQCQKHGPGPMTQAHYLNQLARISTQPIRQSCHIAIPPNIPRWVERILYSSDSSSSSL